MTPNNQDQERDHELAMDHRNVFNLALHDSMMIESGWRVTRVPTGWIYENVYRPTPATFVPDHKVRYEVGSLSDWESYIT